MSSPQSVASGDQRQPLGLDLGGQYLAGLATGEVQFDLRVDPTRQCPADHDRLVVVAAEQGRPGASVTDLVPTVPRTARRSRSHGPQHRHRLWTSEGLDVPSPEWGRAGFEKPRPPSRGTNAFSRYRCPGWRPIRSKARSTQGRCRDPTRDQNGEEAHEKPRRRRTRGGVEVYRIVTRIPIPINLKSKSSQTSAISSFRIGRRRIRTCDFHRVRMAL